MSITTGLPRFQARTWWWLSLVAIPVCIVCAVVAAEGQHSYQLISGSYPGAFEANLSALLELIASLSSTVCLGAAVYAAFVKIRLGRDRMSVDFVGDLRIIRWAACIWMLSAAALVPVDAADSSGVSLSRLLTPGALPYLVEATYLPRAWIATLICAILVLVVANFTQKWHSLVFIVGATTLGILAPVVVNQVLVGPNHDFGGDAAIIATPLTAALGGTLWMLLARPLRGRRLTQQTASRFFALGAISWVLIVTMTVVVYFFELAGTGPFQTPTAFLFLVRFGLLLGAGLWGCVAWRRRGSEGALSPRSVAPLVGASLFLVANLGVAAAMVKIAPPQYTVPTNVSQVFLGYNVTAAPTVTALLLDWRVNILFLGLAVFGVGLYLIGYVRLRQRGDAWSSGRTVAWVLGWVVIVFTTSSGIGRYSTASFSTHMILHMSLNMLGPILLVLGGPITLALRVAPAHRPDQPAGLHEWINALLAWPFVRHLYNPLLVWVTFIGSYWVLYFTNIFNLAMRYHWAHQLLDLHFVFAGYLFYSLVIGVDLPPRPVPHIGKLGLVFAAMPFHAFFGVIVMTQSTIIAQQFYNYLDLPWMTNLKADQYLGGGIAWAAGELPLIVVIIALVTQWSKQDARLAKRTDRHLDSGIDDSFEEYNAMLVKLAARREVPLGAQPSQREDS